MNRFDFSTLDRPTITRNTESVAFLTENIGADVAHHHGVLRWEDIDEATRAEMRCTLVRHYTGRLLGARSVFAVSPTLANAERVARLERGLAASERLS